MTRLVRAMRTVLKAFTTLHCALDAKCFDLHLTATRASPTESDVRQAQPLLQRVLVHYLGDDAFQLLDRPPKPMRVVLSKSPQVASESAVGRADTSETDLARTAYEVGAAAETASLKFFIGCVDSAKAELPPPPYDVEELLLLPPLRGSMPSSTGQPRSASVLPMRDWSDASTVPDGQSVRATSPGFTTSRLPLGERQPLGIPDDDAGDAEGAAADSQPSASSRCSRLPRFRSPAWTPTSSLFDHALDEDAPATDEAHPAFTPEEASRALLGERFYEPLGPSSPRSRSTGSESSTDRSNREDQGNGQRADRNVSPVSLSPTTVDWFTTAFPRPAEEGDTHLMSTQGEDGSSHIKID